MICQNPTLVKQTYPDLLIGKMSFFRLKLDLFTICSINLSNEKAIIELEENAFDFAKTNFELDIFALFKAKF